jgi:hypothetical protein
MMEEEQQMIPYERERELKQQYDEAKKRGDQAETKQHLEELVSFYVYYGESFKNSDRPDPQSAKLCLERALKYQKDHPVAHYRYAHLMYGDEEYALVAYHFKQAVDGSREHSLEDTQRLIANIITVNCGLLMARQALEEVYELNADGNRKDTEDSVKREDFLNRMLIDSEEMLDQHIYIKLTPVGRGYISEAQYITEKENMGDQEVKLFVSQHERIIVCGGGKPEPLSQTDFYVAHTILMSAVYLETKDIGEALKNLERVIKPEAIRKCISRMSFSIPYWNIVVDSDIGGNYAKRRRRNGVKYALLCHCSVVVP